MSASSLLRTIFQIRLRFAFPQPGSLYIFHENHENWVDFRLLFLEKCFKKGIFLVSVFLKNQTSHFLSLHSREEPEKKKRKEKLRLNEFLNVARIFTETFAVATTGSTGAAMWRPRFKPHTPWPRSLSMHSAPQAKAARWALDAVHTLSIAPLGIRHCSHPLYRTVEGPTSEDCMTNGPG